MHQDIKNFIDFFNKNKSESDKTNLVKLAKATFNLTTDRKILYCDSFAVRFCYSRTGSFSNTVLSLSALQKYDHIPFFIVLVCRAQPNRFYLANSTFLEKISHSSQELSMDNIKGSFNGSNILKIYHDIPNNEENVAKLFPFHTGITWKENLQRLVEATHHIEPRITKPDFGEKATQSIIQSIKRSVDFINSANFSKLRQYLDERVEQAKDAIFIASRIENVNIRGRLIEVLITSDDNQRKNMLSELQTIEEQLPLYDTKNDLGDIQIEYENGNTLTDIKTKIVYLDSNPKAFNIDKFLTAMADGKSIFFFYFVGIDESGTLKPILCSVYHKQLIEAMVIQHHWSGRNSRGTTQMIGTEINKFIFSDFYNQIDQAIACNFLRTLLAR